MPIFYCTFGQKYATEPHPQGMHPDGWVEVEAPDQSSAYVAAHKAFGDKFCSVYFDYFLNAHRHLYPLGCIGKIAYEHPADKEEREEV